MMSAPTLTVSPKDQNMKRSMMNWMSSTARATVGLGAMRG